MSTSVWIRVSALLLTLSKLLLLSQSKEEPVSRLFDNKEPDAARDRRLKRGKAYR